MRNIDPRAHRYQRGSNDQKHDPNRNISEGKFTHLLLPGGSQSRVQITGTSWLLLTLCLTWVARWDHDPQPDIDRHAQSHHQTHTDDEPANKCHVDVQVI